MKLKKCAEVFVKCNISTQVSLIAVQTVCNTLSGHRYYLTADETIQNDPSLENYEVPISIQDYVVYENALPSPRVLNDHKQVLTIQQDE